MNNLRTPDCTELAIALQRLNDGFRDVLITFYSFTSCSPFFLRMISDQSSALDSEITVDCVICHGLLN